MRDKTSQKFGESSELSVIEAHGGKSSKEDGLLRVFIYPNPVSLLVNILHHCDPFIKTKEPMSVCSC